jgi:hypothetical protein
MYGGGGRPGAFPAFDNNDGELHLDSDKPPPPPVHRTPMHMRQGVLKQEAHRQSMAHGSRPGYRNYDSAPAESLPSANGSVSGSDYSHPSLPRTGSLDTAHDPSRSMQATVEDAPESPQTWQPATFPHGNNRHSGIQRSSLIYEVTPDLAKGAPPPMHASKPSAPPPLNISSRQSMASPRQSDPSISSSTASPHPNTNSGGYAASPRPGHHAQEQIPPLARTPTTYNYSYNNNTYSQSPSPTVEQVPSPTYSSPTYEPPHYGGGASPGGPARRGSFVDHNDAYAMVPAGRQQQQQQASNYNSYTPHSPAPPTPARRGSYMDNDRMTHSPAPLARRGSYIDDHTYDAPRSPAPMRQLNYNDDQGGAASPLPPRERRNSAYENYENALVHLPSAPPSLVPGVDPDSAQEITSRLKRLNSQIDAATAPPTMRGRAQTDVYPAPQPYRNERGPSPSPYAMTHYGSGPHGGGSGSDARSPALYSGVNNGSRSPAPYSGVNNGSRSPTPYGGNGSRSPAPYGGGDHRARSPAPYSGSDRRARSPAPYSGVGGGGARSPAPYEAHSPSPAPNRARGRTPSPMPSPSPSPMPSPRPPPSRMGGRASASPAPPLSSSPGFSGGVPFGPDSFDAIRGGSPVKSDVGSKIIAPDGREIDPSDHLPVESWAPEPEPKKGQQQQQQSSSSQSSPPLSGQQASNMPASGRRPLRIAHRPSLSSSSMHYQPEDRATPSLPPPAPGHGRLQKKTSRTLPPSPGPPPPARTPTHSHAHSHSQGNIGYRSPQPSPRAVPRTTTWDHNNDNYNSNNGGSMGVGYGAGGGGGVGSGSFAHRSTIGGPPAGPVTSQDWALVQELSQIDLGAGRSNRRHRGY